MGLLSLGVFGVTVSVLGNPVSPGAGMNLRVNLEAIEDENGNEAHSEEQAPAQASKSKGDIPNICSLPIKMGPCLAIIPRYYYNAKSGKCEEFGYGGCAGNA